MDAERAVAINIMSWLPHTDDPGDPYDRYAHAQVRARPNPKANRPRTKRRPEHAEAIIGFVTGVDRGRYQTILDQGQKTERTVIAARARELRRTPIVTGDRVALVGDTSGREGTLARVVRIEERSTVLRRSADDTDQVERVMVANADQMLIVVAAAQPEPRVRLVDRSLVAAYDAGITPMLVVTKTDLGDPDALLKNFAGLELPVWCSRIGAEPVAELRTALAGHTTVFVGHSGVGKSTLMNALVPGASRQTGHVNAVTGRGRHTSSSSAAMRLTDASGQTGWVIDTPGVRSFGLGHVSSDRVIQGFTDLAELIAGCPRGCTHRAGAPDCQLDVALADGRLDEVGSARVASLRRLLPDKTSHVDVSPR